MATPGQIPSLHTVAEAAEHLKLSSKTVLRMIHAGELGAYKLGRQWRISEAQLQRLLEASGTA